jgi:hypothetical protein
MRMKRSTWAGLSLACLIAAGCQQAKPVSNTAPTEGNSSVEAKTVAQAVDQMQTVAQGTNSQLAYKATQFGYLYLFDQTTGTFLYRGPVRMGDKFVFEPASSRAQLNKETVDLDVLSNEHDEYRLFFVPG